MKNILLSKINKDDIITYKREKKGIGERPKVLHANLLV